MKHTRPLIVAFISGIFAAAIAAALAGTRTPAAMLAIGFAAAVVLLLVSLSSTGRLHAAAARLEQLALWIEAKPAAKSPAVGIVRPHSAGTIHPATPADTREADLVSALMNLGSRKPAAAAAARWAIDHSAPSAGVADLVKVALRAPQQVAA